jgi:hypothetical protein
MFNKETMTTASSTDGQASSDTKPANTAQVQREWVQARIEEAKTFAQSLSWDQIKDGSWFARLLTASLETYAHEVNADYFRRKYPGVSTDVIVERQIELAQKYAALSGAATAGVYSAAFAGFFGTAGLSGGVTIPTAVTTFVVDVFLTTRIQLRLAYDMAVLYGVPINFQDPDDLFNLIRVAFGIKAGEVFQQSVTKVAPEATRQAVKHVFRGATLKTLTGLKVVGQYLLQKNLIKFAIPVVNISLAAGMNFFITKGVGRLAKETFRERALIREVTRELADLTDLEPLVFMRVMRLVVEADGKHRASEAHLLADLVRHLIGDDETPAWVKQLESEISLNRATLMRDVAILTLEVRAALYDAAVVAATVDREVHPKELEVLRELAGVCEVVFDVAAIKTRVGQWMI